MKPLLLRLAIFAAAALAGPAQSGEPHWPDHLTIGTASPGGTYYVYGEGLARILTRALELPVTMVLTEGPAQNIDLLEAGEAKLGFVTMGIALHAWNGTGAWVGRKPARAMRAIFPMYDTPFHLLVLQDSGIRSIAEMAGKRIGERSLDVLAVGAGVPFPSFVELETKDKVRYVALTSDQIAALRLAVPEVTPSHISPGTYPSLVRPYQTVGLYNFAVAHEDLPSDLIYRAVKAVFENHAELIEVHAAAAATVPANIARNTFLPFHPGAIRYYRQIGIAGLGD
jgi:TRAP-type uncharacterized transport system substrate-binding protein